MSPKRHETQLVYAIRDALLATGRVLLWRQNAGKLCDVHGRMVTYGIGVGSPDLVGILRPSGRFLAIEVKDPNGDPPTPEQLAWHRAATAAGARVYVARSVAEALAGLPVES